MITPETQEINLEIYEGIARETKKPYTAIRVSIGTWSTLVFAKTAFELNYIKSVLEANKL